MNETAQQLQPGPGEYLPSQDIESPNQFLALAIQSKADIEVLRGLMELQREYRAENAKTAYFEALSAFQAECPEIPKTKEVKNNTGKVLYKFAPLADIIKAVGPALKSHGFSWQFRYGESDGLMSAECVLHHCMGHSESNTMHAEPDDSGAKNKIQARGSANSYMARYAFIGVTGITTADQDDDGRSAGALNIEKFIRMSAVARERWEEINNIKEGIDGGDLDHAARAYVQLSEDEIKALWIAPTQGGLFTTDERATMKTTEFREACGKAKDTPY